MTDLNANALEQDADDGDGSHAYRAAQELLNHFWWFASSVYARQCFGWQVVDTREGADLGDTTARVNTGLRQHRDTNVVRNPAPLSDPVILIPDPAIRSPRRLPFSAIVRPPMHRLHILFGARVHNISLRGIEYGYITKGRRYMDEIDQEIKPPT